MIGLDSGISPFNTSHYESVQDTSQHAVTKWLASSFDGDVEQAEIFQQEIKEIVDRCQEAIEEAKNQPIQQTAALELQTAALERMTQELGALLQRHGVCSQNTASLMEEFAKIHTKYRHVLVEVSAFMETPEYIDGMALLAEQYHGASNSVLAEEYLQAQTELIEKHVPEYKAYKEELQQVARNLREPPAVQPLLSDYAQKA